MFKILYIESQEGNAFFEQLHLKELGFRVYPCSKDLAEAMIEEIAPDLCLLEGSREAWKSLEPRMGETPRIFCILEDELYWVESKPSRRAPGRAGEGIQAQVEEDFEVTLSDNLLDGIRAAFHLPSKDSTPIPPAKQDPSWNWDKAVIPSSSASEEVACPSSNRDNRRKSA